MTDVARYVTLIRSVCPDLPDELSEEAEAQLMKQLAPWHERLREARKAYQAGTLERPAETPHGAKERTVVYLSTPMTESERAAAFDLYVQLVAYVAKQVDYWYKRHASRLRAIELEDALSDSLELFYRSLANFDPAFGTRLISWLHSDLRNLLRGYMTSEGSDQVSVEDAEEPAALTGDLESYLDYDEAVRRLCGVDKQLLLVWEYLSMEEETSAQGVSEATLR